MIAYIIIVIFALITLIAFIIIRNKLKNIKREPSRAQIYMEDRIKAMWHPLTIGVWNEWIIDLKLI